MLECCLGLLEAHTDLLIEEKENVAEDLDDVVGDDEEGEGIVLQQYPWEGTDRDYHYEELLGRVFNILRENNPELAGDRRRTVMRPPQVLREGTKKTVFVNFMDLCKTLLLLTPQKNKKKKPVPQDLGEEEPVDSLVEKAESLSISETGETSFAGLKKKKKKSDQSFTEWDTRWTSGPSQPFPPPPPPPSDEQ
ncbi:Eukaryotic translation initiation factor 2 subunit beta [Striga hermonthica]|uniref:Eukaryotic translation initiation factor 2 subunit beta n=1 Tax=Striga hermonthica TaxID=68872 RepID=A0A9N7REV4_STRHE|nr:Eukaryotic translation initiation factor 2 subunit beta [Striga hermonthica]